MQTGSAFLKNKLCQFSTTGRTSGRREALSPASSRSYKGSRLSSCKHIWTGNEGQVGHQSALLKPHYSDKARKWSIWGINDYHQHPYNSSNLQTYFRFIIF
jgi:hypothetical protein